MLCCKKVCRAALHDPAVDLKKVCLLQTKWHIICCVITASFFCYWLVLCFLHESVYRWVPSVYSLWRSPVSAPYFLCLTHTEGSVPGGYFPAFASSVTSHSLVIHHRVVPVLVGHTHTHACQLQICGKSHGKKKHTDDTNTLSGAGCGSWRAESPY